ncbi:MAG: phenylalanine--tRNA ligase subunit beta [Chloroflexota bacterium]
MKFTFNWLKEFVTYSGSPERLAEMLTMAGLEVDSLSPLRQAESDRQDWLFEIGVTPNRGDCLSVAGIAREVAVLTGGDLKSPPASPAGKTAKLDKRITISIEDPQACLRYSAQVVEDVRVVPSPPWMRYRLEVCGIRAINNVVDVTNYVMLETGQPLHAFDFDRLAKKNIVIKSADGIGKFTTLDGMERRLQAGDLLICAGDEPVGLAGVMGGMDSEVRESTRSLLLESANFAPVLIRRTAKRLALHSEASHRFERGVDPEGTIPALNRTVYLLRQFASARAEGRIADRYPGKMKQPPILLRQKRVEKLLGLKLECKQAAKLLGALGMKTKQQARAGAFAVIPPTWRPDVTREADVIEELARLHGYDRVPSAMPLLRGSGAKTDLRLAWERRLRALLTGEGLTEVINLPFTGEVLNKSFPGIWKDAPAAIAVLNPLTKENAEMRHSLLPGLIDNVRLNLAYKVRSSHLFHLGKVFSLDADDEALERHCIAGLMYGPRQRHGLRCAKEIPFDFLDCKGLVEAVLECFRLRESVVWTPANAGYLHPGQSANLLCGDARLGYAGQLHPDLGDQFEMPALFVFELDFEKLLEYAPRRIAVHALPRYPAVERDVALVVDRDFASQRVIHWIDNLGEALIEHVEVFDQYVGAPVPEGKKSLAYKVSYRAEDRTLTDTEINELHQRLVERLGETFGAERRS